VLEWNARGPSGLSAERSIFPTTAWTATCTPARKNKAALIWESEPGEVRTYTYQQLWLEVQKFANVLKSLGVRKGDRVAIYMGMTPELPIAMLACARIGAPHSIVFGGFSANALVDRIHDSHAVAVITQDGSYRRGAEVKLFPWWKKR
jgi:acetyl-CoA synthetase